jgi:ABC-type branched-subunit amino acid transport system ATPase component
MLLSTRDLTKSFGALIAVNKVNLRIKEGEFTILVGPNGAGKTTLFDLITGRQEPTGGEVYYKGINITALPPEKRVDMGIGRTFQISSIFPTLTVFENIALAVQRKKVRGLKWFLSCADMNEEVAKVTDDIIDQVGLSHERDQIAGNLPHGLKRNLEIGMALANNPELLLLDEPLSGLSTEEAIDLLNYIKNVLRRRYTILMVEHKIDLIRDFSERIIVMHQGSIIADGSYSEIAQVALVEEAYLGRRVRE